MQYEILARPMASAAKLTLQGGESVTCEVGAMIAMSTGFNVETTSRNKGGGGGIVKGPETNVRRGEPVPQPLHGDPTQIRR